MTEQKRLYNKYTVINNETGKQAEGEYFILKPKTDAAARAAVLAYAEATEDKELADDLVLWMITLNKQVTEPDIIITEEN